MMHELAYSTLLRSDGNEFMLSHSQRSSCLLWNYRL